MNKLQEMRQQLERDEKRRHRDEKRRQRKVLLLLFLWLIAFFGGMVLAVWIADQFSNRHSSEGVMFSYIGLWVVAYIVGEMVKGIKTGELRATTDGESIITKRKNEPKKFWWYVYINLVVAVAILLTIFSWIFIVAGW
tara:strand:+ start:63 stop:476 length:414 start_codon:yes stop_codon:yes gene_type:complete